MRIDHSHAGLFRLTVIVVSIAMALYQLWAIAFGSPEAIPSPGTHLMFAIVLVFLTYRFRTKSEDAALAATAVEGAMQPKQQLPTLFDYALLVIGVMPILHLFYNYEYVTNRIFYVDDLTVTDMV